MKKIISLILTASLLLLCLSSCSKANKSYKKLDEHITESAVAQNGVVNLTLGNTAEPDGAVYTRAAVRTDDSITLALLVTEDGKFLYGFSLILNKGALDLYKWEYSSRSGDTMSGTVDPKEYLKNAYTLNYITTNIKDPVAASSASGLAKSLLNYLLLSLEGDLGAIGLDAVDFDFKDFKD